MSTTAILVEDIMTSEVDTIPSNTTLEEAARHMRQLDCGFLPLCDDPESKLQGVVTDRDLVVRGLAEGMDPKTTPVNKVKTARVLYCYRTDDIRDAAYSMRNEKVNRLIVLDSEHSKRMCGIVTLGDLARHSEDPELAGDTTKGIKSAA